MQDRLLRRVDLEVGPIVELQPDVARLSPGQVAALGRNGPLEDVLLAVEADRLRFDGVFAPAGRETVTAPAGDNQHAQDEDKPTRLHRDPLVMFSTGAQYTP